MTTSDLLLSLFIRESHLFGGQLDFCLIQLRTLLVILFFDLEEVNAKVGGSAESHDRLA